MKPLPHAVILLVLISVLAPACRGSLSDSSDLPVLVDVTAERGLDFVHDCGAYRTHYMPELMGPGLALMDDDNDGDLDLYLINGGPAPGTPLEGAYPRNRLYRQQEDGSFVDATEGSGLDDDGYGMGVAVGDYDNDGFVDVYVTNYGPNRLFRNRGDGTFQDVTAIAGVGDDSWSTSASFLDYDADGRLDLYVTNYLQYDPGKSCPAPTGAPEFCPPGMFEGTIDRLYHNEGSGRFADATESSGIGSAAMKGLGVVSSDLSGDGRVDIYVANDQEQNNLWVNQGDGTFSDDAVVLGAAFNEAGGTEASMGIAIGDLDNDLDIDLYVTHLRSESNTAYVNQGGFFRDGTAALGLHGPTIRYTGFGAFAPDLEHDGDLDLVVVNGHVFRAHPEPGAALDPFWNDYAQPGLVFLNDGNSRFRDVSAEVGSFGTDPQVGRSIAAGDIDGDGDLDFAVGNCNGRARLFLNETPSRGHWLLVRARDEQLRRDTYGARITLTAGGRKWVGEVNPATGYLSSSDPRVHFGLGAAARVESISVLWPGGVLEQFPGAASDQMITLTRGRGTPATR